MSVPETRKDLARSFAEHKKNCRECHEDSAGRMHYCRVAKRLMGKLQALAKHGL